MNPIRLEQIQLTHVRVPLREPFRISNGEVAEKDAILVQISAEGLVGLGEASPMAGSFYSPQTPASSWKLLTEKLVPRLAAARQIDLQASWLPDPIEDPFAACGLDNALWDLAGRVSKRPLAEMLGGQVDRAIESGLAVGIHPSIDELLERIDHFLRQGGYKRLKIKVQPGWDVEPLEAIRRLYPTLPLMVDANCAYERGDIDWIAAWDRFDLMLIEQPLHRDDLEGHAQLAARCRTPICLDESAESVAAVEEAIRFRAASVINIKLQRLGSISAACRVHDLAAEAGIGCWMGTMPELAVGSYAAMHFATLPNILYPTDVESSERWFVADVTNPPIICRQGLLALPGGFGLGVQLDHETVKRYKVREFTSPLSGQLII